MTDYFDSLLVKLNGPVDGYNKTFTTPWKYVAGTIRLVWNGQVYEKDDDRKGWEEVNDLTIQTDDAPRVNDVLQAFFQNKDSQHLGFDSVIGSPFDPQGILP